MKTLGWVGLGWTGLSRSGPARVGPWYFAALPVSFLLQGVAQGVEERLALEPPLLSMPGSLLFCFILRLFGSLPLNLFRSPHICFSPAALLTSIPVDLF